LWKVGRLFGKNASGAIDRSIYLFVTFSWKITGRCVDNFGLNGVEGANQGVEAKSAYIMFICWRNDLRKGQNKITYLFPPVVRFCRRQFASRLLTVTLRF
jgi:hypothetical protein